jgi:hypothetical protein
MLASKNNLIDQSKDFNSYCKDILNWKVRDSEKDIVRIINLKNMVDVFNIRLSSWFVRSSSWFNEDIRNYDNNYSVSGLNNFTSQLNNVLLQASTSDNNLNALIEKRESADIKYSWYVAKWEELLNYSSRIDIKNRVIETLRMSWKNISYLKQENNRINMYDVDFIKSFLESYLQKNQTENMFDKLKNVNKKVIDYIVNWNFSVKDKEYLRAINFAIEEFLLDRGQNY